MKYYPVGLKWETKGYRCEIIGKSDMSDGEYHWISHKVDWVPKFPQNHRKYKLMSTKKLEKEFKRLGIRQKPENQNHFEDEGLFEL